jgi:hypothetical protein
MTFPVSAGRAGIALTALVCAVMSAHAGSYPKGKGSGPLLTRNELRQCMALHERTRTQRDEIDRLEQLIGQDKDDIARRGADLKEQMVWLDRYSEPAVAQYNEQSQARDKMIDAYEARVAAHNAQAEAWKADTAAFAKNCENRRYDEKDEQAIQKGK